jgi:hypothetical protein
MGMGVVVVRVALRFEVEREGAKKGKARDSEANKTSLASDIISNEMK